MHSKSNNDILVLGASSNPQRTSNMVAKLLVNKGYRLRLLGHTEGKVSGVPIETEVWEREERAVDAVTVFLKPERQKKYYDYILSLKPKSIIFNPGSENEELEALAKKNNIKIITCCTIAMIAVGML